jgi:regulatory protein
MTKTARAAAMDLLAIREHSTQELHHKLSRRGFDQNEIDTALAALEQENLLSNARYAEAYITARMEKGMGPVRIQAELRERGVDDELIQRYLEPRDSLWDRQAERVRRKKFGARRPADFQARSRQARFLNYRGFTSEQIRQVLDTEPEIL